MHYSLDFSFGEGGGSEKLFVSFPYVLSSGLCLPVVSRVFQLA